MNILVCIKPVPDPEKYGQLIIDKDTKRIVREGIPTVINPSDKNALEEAIRLKERFGKESRVTVVSMAPEFSRDKLTECLAMGADEAYLLSDRVFGGADTYATSYVLSAAAVKICGASEAKAGRSAGFDVILMGNESADGATSHIPSQLAEWLRMQHVCRVCRLDIDAAEQGAYRFRAWKKTEEGKIVFEGSLPCVIAVTSDINKPRLVNAMGIIKAKKKPLTVWSNENLALDESRLGLAGSPTKAGELTSPDMKRAAQDLGKNPDEVAEKILNLIKKAGV